ncbi:MAG: ATP-binding cassette domain-containing protein, partial [Thermogutta sp.]|nr:ATP-binding cassette domain-containing protein [Thermogutta sp.]
NTAVYDRMTAWEMVEYFGLLYGWTREQLRPRMEHLFDRLKMNEIRDVPGGRMSTGMKQKVSIARALVHDPPVLIFDEPTSGLDVLVARNLLQTIRELRDQGKCIIFSTHIMREVEKLCDRVAILCRGRILTQGTPDELRERFGEDDLEEIFFRLITEAELAENAEPAEDARPAADGGAREQGAGPIEDGRRGQREHRTDDGGGREQAGRRKEDGGPAPGGASVSPGAGPKAAGEGMRRS